MIDISYYKSEVSKKAYSKINELFTEVKAKLDNISKLTLASDIEKQVMTNSINSRFLVDVENIYREDIEKTARIEKQNKIKKKIESKGISKVLREHECCHGLDLTLVPSCNHKKALMMRLDGISYKNISDKFNVTTETVKKWIFGVIRKARHSSWKFEGAGTNSPDFIKGDLVAESDFEKSGQTANGYILRLRDVARALSK